MLGFALAGHHASNGTTGAVAEKAGDMPPGRGLLYQLAQCVVLVSPGAFVGVFRQGKITNINLTIKPVALCF